MGRNATLVIARDTPNPAARRADTDSATKSALSIIIRQPEAKQKIGWNQRLTAKLARSVQNGRRLGETFQQENFHWEAQHEKEQDREYAPCEAPPYLVAIRRGGSYI